MIVKVLDTYPQLGEDLEIEQKRWKILLATSPFDMNPKYRTKKREGYASGQKHGKHSKVKGMSISYNNGCFKKTTSPIQPQTS